MKLLNSYCYDDVLLRPRHSEIKSRKDISLNVKLGGNKVSQINLKTPFISSPMDTVTEDKMAISMALTGGLGIIHRFQSISEQVRQIRNVKRYLQYIFTDPFTISSESSINHIYQKQNETNIKTLFVKNNTGNIIGICTNRDITHLQSNDKNINIINIMTPYEELHKIFLEHKRFEWLLENQNTEDFHQLMIQIKDMMGRYKIQKIPLYEHKIIANNKNEVLKTKKLLGMATHKSVNHYFNNRESACLDKYGRLCVGAAIGIKPESIERADKCIKEGVDLLCIDVANGHNQNTLDIIAKIREKYPDIVLMGGNVCTGEGVLRLAEIGCDCIRVGIGSGSICSTRLETGIGYGQWSAVNECFEALVSNKKYKDIKLISDGGSLGKTGNKTKALACGASAIMLGRSLAGCHESPGIPIIRNGKMMKYFRGMASTMATLSHKERKGENQSKLGTAEGVDGVVEVKGNLQDYIEQICGGVRSGLSYLGINNIDKLHNLIINNQIEWVLTTSIGMSESGIRIKTL
jgi:IMP dehydrogenase